MKLAQVVDLKCPRCALVEYEGRRVGIISFSLRDITVVSLELHCEMCQISFRISFDAAGQYVSYPDEVGKSITPAAPVENTYREFVLSGAVANFLFRRWERRRNEDTSIGLMQKLTREGWHPLNSDLTEELGTFQVAKVAAREIEADIRRREWQNELETWKRRFLGWLEKRWLFRRFAKKLEKKVKFTGGYKF